MSNAWLEQGKQQLAQQLKALQDEILAGKRIRFDEAAETIADSRYDDVDYSVYDVADIIQSVRSSYDPRT